MKSDSSSEQITLEESTNSIAIDYFSRKVLLGTVSGKICIQILTPEGAISSTSAFPAHSSPITSIDWAHPGFGELFVRFVDLLIDTIYFVYLVANMREMSKFGQRKVIMMNIYAFSMKECLATV